MKRNRIILIAFIGVIFTLFSFVSNDRMRIVIDAGHGGKDYGAVNGDYKEKDIVRSISSQIEKLFGTTDLVNIELFTPEDKDIFKDMEERVKALNSLHPNILVSLHVNSSTNKNERGVTIYVSPKNKDYKKSKEIAEKLLKEFPKEPGVENKIADANILLLKNAECPAVMVEVGYISNNDDLKNMISEAGQKVIAEKIIKGLME